MCKMDKISIVGTVSPILEIDTTLGKVALSVTANGSLSIVSLREREKGKRFDNWSMRARSFQQMYSTN